MLRGGVLAARRTQCTRRRYATHGHSPKPVPILLDASLETFKDDAFNKESPALLPRQHFRDMPAVQKWFLKDARSGTTALNTAYLSKFGSTIVPLEISNNDQFARVEQSLSFFLECVVQASSAQFRKHRNRYFSSYVPGARAVKRTTESNAFFTSASNMTAPTARVYLAQAPLDNLPRALTNDLPTPEVVLKAGKGDVYDSSIWLGQAPTYTPLHRDPNPNLFVQLAGKKVVRLFSPQVGNSIFAKVQERIGGSASATMRGEEMMQGAENSALEKEVWHNEEFHAECWEARLRAGDGIFIPKGWWHSVKGIGSGMTGSVNWWFR